MMRMNLNRALAVVVLGLAILAVVLAYPARQAAGRTEEGGSGGSPHYSVVMTEGHNLLVTDNGTNKVYFYTIDKDKPIGSPLKLRASVDLNQVGKDEVHITPHNLEKFEPANK